MKTLKTLCLMLAALLALPVLAQDIPQLPVDKDVRIGKLPNGLTYYIRHNALPENRANFYIAQKVGSVQEEDNQRGLAHFLEHMCFNGSDHFAPGELVKYCERIGVKFGENLNAYTSTDETVYNIDDVPTTEQNIDSCLLILRDWADGLLLLPEEIDKERGVIHEEWRMRSSASGRMLERSLPTLYPGSRYALRYPIGTMEVVDNFRPEELRAYYEKWYRPDLQGLVIVGDINVDQVEAKIKALFSSIKMPENPAAYEHYPVPDNAEPIYVVEKDKEQAQPIMQILFKQDPLPEEARNTQAYYLLDYLNSVATGVLNERFSELSQKPDCPFLLALVGYDNYIMSKTKDALQVLVIPKPGEDAKAVKVAMQEVLRAAHHGFTASEISRADEELLSGMERTYDNRDKQYNSFYVEQYVRNFLEKDPIPDYETKYNTYKQLSADLKMQGLTAALASSAFAEYTAHTDTNFVFFAEYPDKEGTVVPSADEFRKAVAEAVAEPLEAYVDNVKDEPLVPVLPKKGKIAKEEQAPFGFTLWTLDNGARVYSKKTDFDDSEVIAKATSFGGKFAFDEKERVNTDLMTSAMSMGGWGNFTSTELNKKMAGKQASVAITLTNSTEDLDCSATPKDLRTLFELIYLHFQAPKDDPEAYNNLMSILRTSLEGAERQPMSAFSDSLSCTLYGHHPRKARVKLADLAQADYGRMKQMYTERFNTAGDFDFFFVGAFNEDSLRAYVEQYIAPLPAVQQREKYTERNVWPVEGKVDNHFKRQMETPQCTAVQIWSGVHPYTLAEAEVVNAFGEILTQRYLKSIREDAGIAYSVFTQASLDYGRRDDYTVITQCPVKPEKLDSALLLMQQAIDDIARDGVTAEELDKVQQFQLKEYADNQKKNDYWLSLISNQVTWGHDERTGKEAAIKAVTSDAIRAFARDVLKRDGNCVTVSISPETTEESK